MSLGARQGLGAVIAVIVLGALVFAAWIAGHGPRAEAQAVQPAQFSPTVTNPYVPLSTVPVTLLEGVDRDPDEPKPLKTRVETRVLPKTRRVAGVEVTAVRVKEYEAGRLKEATTDFFAQRADGAVIYFGQRVDNYRNGKIVAHRGEWTAGKRKAKPGLFMPGDPKLGQVFRQERVPGVAIDESTVLALGVTVKTPGGTFTNCMKVRDFARLDKNTEFKFYCAGVGLVRDDEKHARSSLVSYQRAG